MAAGRRKAKRKPAWAEKCTPRAAPSRTGPRHCDPWARSGQVESYSAPNPQCCLCSLVPPAGWCKGGVGGGARPGQARHMRRNLRMHAPCIATGVQQRAAVPFSQGRQCRGSRISPLQSWPPGPAPKRRPESSRLSGLWLQGGLSLYSGGTEQEEARLSSAKTLSSSLLHPQSQKQSLRVVGNQ